MISIELRLDLLPVTQAKKVDDNAMTLILVPLSWRVKCLCPRYRVAKVIQPVLSPIRHALKENVIGR